MERLGSWLFQAAVIAFLVLPGLLSRTIRSVLYWISSAEWNSSILSCSAAFPMNFWLSSQYQSATNAVNWSENWGSLWIPNRFEISQKGLHMGLYSLPHFPLHATCGVHFQTVFFSWKLEICSWLMTFPHDFLHPPKQKSCNCHYSVPDTLPQNKCFYCSYHTFPGTISKSVSHVWENAILLFKCAEIAAQLYMWVTEAVLPVKVTDANQHIYPFGPCLFVTLVTF